MEEDRVELTFEGWQGVFLRIPLESGVIKEYYMGHQQ